MPKFHAVLYERTHVIGKELFDNIFGDNTVTTFSLFTKSAMVSRSSVPIAVSTRRVAGTRGATVSRHRWVSDPLCAALFNNPLRLGRVVCFVALQGPTIRQDRAPSGRVRILLFNGAHSIVAFIGEQAPVSGERKDAEGVDGRDAGQNHAA